MLHHRRSTDAETEPLGPFCAALDSFVRDVTSVPDSFGLLRHPELARYVLTLRAARDQASTKGCHPLRLCDLGGYVGVIAAAMSEFGYKADVIDSYGELLTQPEHEDLREWWATHRLTIHDVDLQAANLRLPFDDDSFDLVTLLAVIEHFPHSPRLVLNEIRRVLRPDGLLIVDTPNAGAFETRVSFARRGESLWAPIRDLYESEIPFPGHKRCYSRRELLAVLEWSGFQPKAVELFDLGPPLRTGSLKSKILFNGIYRILQRRFPDLRGYIWVAARALPAV